MPSQMEHATETMTFTFHRCAGDKGYLTKEGLRVLMEKEFPGFVENQKDPLAVDKIMRDLDQCQDGRVGFQSFFSLIAGLTIACNDYFVVHMKQKGKKWAAEQLLPPQERGLPRGRLRNLCPTASPCMRTS
ncbi:protein S100-A10-like [Phyllostomus hastatus]|uniref:protein S100-A10-like n=1 Tax=Phyllostomus hastatus TaxID=9423 RepID=UPI001E682CA4|nr:protein S100-A10-like [Phyllostomus hastatus]